MDFLHSKGCFACHLPVNAVMNGCRAVWVLQPTREGLREGEYLAGEINNGHYFDKGWAC